jgi:glycine cleavage system H lipoate-binding protein
MMDQKSSRPEGQSFGTGQFKDPKANSVSDSLNRGKDAVTAAANDAADSSGADLQAIRNDLNSLKDTLSRFMSQASNEAVKTARQVTSNVAGQVSDVASDLADRAAST